MFTRVVHRRPRRELLVALGLFVLGLLLTFAQQPAAQNQPQPGPTFRTEANYIRVDVYATTPDGVAINDLRSEDFELLEDRVPQTIDQFSPIVIRGASAPTLRPDPRTPEDSRQAATEARARIFVLFLDAMHVDQDASRRIARPLTDALRRLLGPDDLVAIVSPRSSTQAITFTRQIDQVESTLDRPWGARDRIDYIDDVERKYAQCYPGMPRRPGQLTAPDLGIAQEMILRRREEQTFDAIEALVTYLRDVREERKAVIAVTNGWRVYTRNPSLTRAIDDTVPSAPRPGFDPRLGKLSTDPIVNNDPGTGCEADRMRLANLDHTLRFRELLDKANRANVSFYPVDPRGLVVFDDDIVPVAGVGQNPTIGPVEDNRRLGERHTTLRTMAESTDGIAVLETNRFGPALQRLSTDLSAYYLLGYYSTGKLDGKFHAITVRVKRPGVQIRARRGYLAANTATAPAASPIESAASASAAAEAQAITGALGSLAILAREPTLFIHASAAWPASATPTMWAVVELGRHALAADFAKGGEADVLLIDPGGITAGSGHMTFSPGSGSARVSIAPRALPPGNYEVRVRARGAGSAQPSNESTRITVPASADGSTALFFRRGPTTANKELPTADLRFRRSDTLRLAVPVTATTAPGAGRLLDRTGKALSPPVTVTIADESDGSRWISAQAALAPLAAGDYLLEVTVTDGSGQRRTLTAFRVVP